MAFKSLMRGFRRFFMNQFNKQYQFKKFHWIESTLFQKVKDFLYNNLKLSFFLDGLSKKEVEECVWKMVLIVYTNKASKNKRGQY